MYKLQWWHINIGILILLEIVLLFLGLYYDLTDNIMLGLSFLATMIWCFIVFGIEPPVDIDSDGYVFHKKDNGGSCHP